MKIYLLRGDYDNSFFIEKDKESQKSIVDLSMDRYWKAFENYNPTVLELHRSNNGKKNYNFDFSGFLNPFLIFSQDAINILNPILYPRGQFLDVISDSKRKKYVGYYPTNSISNCVNFEKSVYRKVKNGIRIEKLVLLGENINEQYLFTIPEDESWIFVTEKFKKIAEENNFKGFRYKEIELS